MPASIPNSFGRDVYWDTELKFKDLAIFRIRELTKEKISA